jgi:hypothetical protein
LLLDADSGEFAQNVKPVRQVLKLDQLDFPIALLLGNDRLKGDGGVAVTSSCVVVDDMEFFHCGGLCHKELWL